MTDPLARFGRLEWSDPRYERDHLRCLTFGSPALGGRGDVTLFVPPGSEDSRDLPLVLLLHGVYSSHWAWALRGGAHVTAARLIESGRLPPMVLVMPSDGLWAQGTGYLPHSGTDYERWIVEDVLGCVTAALPQLGASSPRFIAGLSVGGFGALRLGAKYAPLFRGISAHSALTHLDAFDALLPQEAPYRLGPDEDRAVASWLERRSPQLPPLRFDCGLEDKFLADNRALHEQLVRGNVPHRYEEFEGGHTWAYWAAHLQDSLLFFTDLLKAPAKGET